MSSIDSEEADPRGALAAFDARWPGLRQRFGSLALALAIEVVLILVLLTLGSGIAGDEKRSVAMTSVSFAPEKRQEETPTPEKAARKSALVPQPKSVPPSESPTPVTPLPLPMPSPAAVIPLKPTSPPAAAPAPAKIGVRLRDDASGPAGAAGPSMSGDSQVVGSGPNGEPVYGARWYREPSNQELRGYLSTVNGPGWALINCRTVPQWRVEDCYLIDQFPDPSMMGKAVLAAAWQFQVRPPQVGGKSMVGAWVRIRISYEIRRERGSGG